MVSELGLREFMILSEGFIPSNRVSANKGDFYQNDELWLCNDNLDLISLEDVQVELTGFQFRAE